MDDLVKLRAWIKALSSEREEAVEDPPAVDLDPALVQAELGRALAAAEDELAARSAKVEAEDHAARYTGSDVAAALAGLVVRNLRAARDAVARLGLATPLRRAAGGSPGGEILAVLTDPRSSANLVRATVAALGPQDLVLVPALVRMLMEADEPCPPFSLLTRHAVAQEALQQIGSASLGPLLAIVEGMPTAPPESVRYAVVRGFGGDAVVPLCDALIRAPAGGVASDWIADLLVVLKAEDRLAITLADFCRATSGAAHEWAVARLLRHAGDITAARSLLTLAVEHGYRREQAIELALQEVSRTRCESSGTAEFLAGALGEADPAVRKLALLGLYRLGTRAAPALPALRAAAADSDPVIARMAVNAIRSVEHGS
jgi:hypothetical protein